MAIYKGKGIVLRSIRYGESDRILDLYTQDAGLVSAIAKGIRRTKSRFGGRLEPLSCVNFLAYEGRTLDTVTQAEVLRSFHLVREDLARLKAAGSMTVTIRALLGDSAADRRVFNLLYHALDALESRADGYRSVEIAFSLKLSILAGYTPRLDACVSCERDPGDTKGFTTYFAPNLGGVLCPGCRTTSGDSFPLPPSAVVALQTLVVRPMREAAIEERLEEGLRRAVSAHVLAHAPGSIMLAAPDQSALRPA